jgi:hypothetical protein
VLPELAAAGTPGFTAASPPGGGADTGDFASDETLAPEAAESARGAVVTLGMAVSTGDIVVTRGVETVR